MRPRGKRYEEVFEVLRNLGEGTFGTVRAARHRNLGVEVLTYISKRTLYIDFT
jgi:serine/threonine protein kinase